MSVFTVNIALNKSASQTNPKIGELYDASNAVDGRKTNLTLKGGQCASSKEKMETATWWVNLSSIHSIHHITIYFRTGNEKLGIQNRIHMHAYFVNITYGLLIIIFFIMMSYALLLLVCKNNIILLRMYLRFILTVKIANAAYDYVICFPI